MSVRDVEFRFLQVVANHVADERVTVGLLHWDGTELRIAVNPGRVPDALGAKPDLQSLLRSIETSYLPMAKHPSLSASLDDLIQAPLGEAGLLTWSALKIGQTRDSKTHFEQLASALGLVRSSGRRRSTMEPKFISFAEKIALSIARPDLIRAHHVLRGLVEHESPLSWKNGVWRHTFPVDVRASDANGLDRRIERLFGRIDATVPREEVGVIVAVHETDPYVDESLARIEHHIRLNLAGRVESLRAPVTTGEPSFAAVDQRVRADVGNASARTRNPDG
jgi:hypothetical protein